MTRAIRICTRSPLPENHLLASDDRFDTGGMIIQCAAKIGIGPKAMLYAKHIDTVSAAGILLADIWDNNRIVCVDELGDDFLNTVKTGDTVSIAEDGTVTVG